jgi:hypothetical protein
LAKARCSRSRSMRGGPDAAASGAADTPRVLLGGWGKARVFRSAPVSSRVAVGAPRRRMRRVCSA